MNRLRKGLTLAEVVLATFVGVVLLVSVTPLLRSLFQENNVRTWSYTSGYGANTYYSMPAFGEFRNAAALMTEFQDLVKSSSATFVIGGYRATPSDSESGGQRPPIKAGTLFSSIPGLNAAVNLATVQNSYDFDVGYLTPQIGAAGKEATYSASDFSVVTLSGLNTVTSITQVRRYTATIDGDSLAIYEVVLDRDLGSARNATYGDAGQNRWAYRFALPIAEDVWTLPAGALHYWFRYDTDWQRREEGPTRLIFPDPYLYAGAQPNGDTVPFSRFIFFIPPNN